MKLFNPLLIAGAALALAAAGACAQTTSSGQAVSIPTPTPGPVGTASTALAGNTGTISGASIIGGMGAGVNVATSSATAPIVPGIVTINSNGNTVGATSSVAGSVQINNGGPGTVTGAPIPISTVPTYVIPGTGLGTTIVTTGTNLIITNPNPGSVQ